MAIAPALVLLVIVPASVILIIVGVLALRGQGAAKVLGVAAIVAGLLLPFAALLGALVTGARTGLLVPVMMVAGLLGLVVWITALADCVQNEPDERNNRLIWVIIIVFGQIIGALLYLLWWRPKRKSEAQI